MTRPSVSPRRRRPPVPAHQPAHMTTVMPAGHGGRWRLPRRPQALRATGAASPAGAAAAAAAAGGRRAPARRARRRWAAGSRTGWPPGRREKVPGPRRAARQRFGQRQLQVHKAHAGQAPRAAARGARGAAADAAATHGPGLACSARATRRSHGRRWRSSSGQPGGHARARRRAVAVVAFHKRPAAPAPPRPRARLLLPQPATPITTQSLQAGKP